MFCGTANTGKEGHEDGHLGLKRLGFGDTGIMCVICEIIFVELV